MVDIEQMQIKLKTQIGEKLFFHCNNTMNTAKELALFYGVDTEQASIAGLLHDCGKLKNIGSLEHAALGSKLANTEYNIEDKEILDAILYHTTGRKNMTMLEKIIYISDKIEPNRHYYGVAELRKLVYNDIDYAIIKSLENTFSYLKSKDIEIDKQSIDTLEYLKCNK
ncbi:bis(5'-nucleosyl)-tetraphosphatase (symmetrical) YqeK [Sedimentibacter sp. zth1]|uniref:bis(5'-nucleosyl)-tetraphosphatase (symmetrical) YqeK n=1 Tax=Sedimentibacter sp. zth1 TaxID=2816908 RepID=UPI001A920C8C|nr:bis(5'-nucleosyl)-tetraphosphatase (symmetrical) YqeK [Sedimentibacter sp. zth1]QSX06968.1 bis(5'-nucleosyl)-tetraphosphatase (symmetrical) YqeK [Sedimentibacter sp. zth1]